MVSFKSLAFTLLAAAAASASITGIVPMHKPFHATRSSKLKLTFTTSNGLSPVYNWFAVIGVQSNQTHFADSELGHFVTNLDFVKLGKSLTVCGIESTS